MGGQNGFENFSTFGGRGRGSGGGSDDVGTDRDKETLLTGSAYLHSCY